MQNTSNRSTFAELLSPRLAEAKVNGTVEERTYRGFGLTLRFRRKLANPGSAEVANYSPGESQTASPAAEQATQEATVAANHAAIAVQEESGLGSTTRQDDAPDLGADHVLGLLAASTAQAGAEVPAIADLAPVPPSGQYAILSGKTAAVIGFPVEDAAQLGQALAGQFCSFLFLSQADAEFRRGATNGCDILILHAPNEWAAPGTLHPASLLKTKKPIVMLGEREVLAALAPRSQGGLRELVPAPWRVDDTIWRAAALLGRVQEPRARNGRKNQRKRVIIGDESAARALVHAVLAQEGMDCFVAANGVDTLAMARSKCADVVIVDVSLPGLDGFQVLAEIRRDPALQGTIVILLTARQAEADVLRGFGLGANDYVTKPFSPMELAARVKRFFEKPA